MLDRKSVEEVLQSRVRPALEMDGGDIELVDVQEN
ncbi:MAG: NifU family protein, partial [Candidatus Latescibacteria bacterium]|nr:NifU family protein [Candidatus Latescibacterota bacterium]